MQKLFSVRTPHFTITGSQYQFFSTKLNIHQISNASSVETESLSNRHQGWESVQDTEVSKCRCIRSYYNQCISKGELVEYKNAIQLTGHEKWDSIHLNFHVCM